MNMIHVALEKKGTQVNTIIDKALATQNTFTSSLFFAESSHAISAPAIKQPGFEDTNTADLASALAKVSSMT